MSFGVCKCPEKHEAMYQSEQLSMDSNRALRLWRSDFIRPNRHRRRGTFRFRVWCLACGAMWNSTANFCHSLPSRPPEEINIGPGIFNHNHSLWLESMGRNPVDYANHCDLTNYTSNDLKWGVE